MSDEEQSRERQREIHDLRIELKRQLLDSGPGTDRNLELTRLLDALDRDNDAAQDQWFKDLTDRFHP